MASDSYEVSLKQAGLIKHEERDCCLKLHKKEWPYEVGEWKAEKNNEAQYLFRKIQFNAEENAQRQLWEAIVRFPSAPIYGVHRKYEYPSKIDRINYHTFRLLRRSCLNQKPGPVNRIYLFHNGLNEIDHLEFYYRIADLLLKNDKKDEESACIIRPLPGHLTRYPFSSDFTERPLDRYLGDASDLYRQFLRYMLETQWLLSILVPFRSYRVVAGLHLLAEGNEIKDGRAGPDQLRDAIYKAWKAAYDATPRDRDRGKSVTKKAIENTIKTIRWLTGWKKVENITDPPPEELVHPPALHVIGYSLGGFFAQSVFFSWPFAIASATTLASGGALREIAPKAFSHPEEWKAVMQSLRYELDNAMIEGRLHRDAGKVAGIQEDYFSYFHRIFYEVFLQDFRGPYQSRVSEYVSRLLFMVGGKDPVVRPQALLDASPECGINIIQVANLDHFLFKADKMEEWRKFWGPQICRVIHSFSERAELILAMTLHSNWWNTERTELLKPTGSKSHGDQKVN